MGAVGLLVWPRALIFIAGEAAALALLLRLWAITAGGSLSQSVYQPLSGIQLSYRVDHLGLFFAITGIALGLLLALPWLDRPMARTGRRGAWVLTAQFGMVSAVLAGGLETLAAGWAMAVAGLILLALLQRRVAPPIAMDGPTSRYVAIQASAAALLLAGAVAAETRAGTGAFDSIPVSAFDVRGVLLLGAAPIAALMTLQLLCRALHRPLLASLAAVTVVVPMSVYVLVRIYDLGGGRLPDSRLNASLVAIGGVTALGFSVASLWAVDLGAAVARLAQAAAGITLVALGAGTGLALAVGILAPISLGLGIAALLTAAQAGGGRLPAAAGAWSRWLVGAPVLVALAWIAGLPVGLASFERLAAVSAGFDAGGLAAAPSILAVLALPVMLVAAYDCGRFGGGRAPTGEARTRLLLLGVALVVAGFAVPSLQIQAAGLAAGVSRLPAPELQSAVASVRPGATGSVIAAALIALAAVGLAAQRRVALADGFPGATFSLPPRLAVAPGIYGVRFGAASRRQGGRIAGLVRRHPLVAGILAWGVAAFTAATLLR